MQKIDCHTHIINNEIAKEYFDRTDGYAIVLGFLKKFETDRIKDDSWETVKNNPRLFLCPAIDLERPIPPQLAEIEGRMDGAKIVGLKIFLTYQKGRANDEKMMCIYDFAQKHGLTITYHTGSCSLVLPTDNDMEGSQAKYVAEVARKYPDVNFVVAHMDDPRFDECIRILHDNPNMYSDFSGAYEPGTHEGSDMEWAIQTFAKAINQYDDTYRQMLYGTDFCPPINLTAIEEYDVTISRIFPQWQHRDIYFENCLRAFPKMREYIAE